MKVCVILSDDYKRKLRSLNRYITLPVGMTLFEYYKAYAGGDISWLTGRIIDEVVKVNSDMMFAAQRTGIHFLMTGQVKNFYISDVIPLLQQTIFKG